MDKRNAKKLHNRDGVEVRVAPGEWVPAHVLGDPTVTEHGIFVNVLTSGNQYIRDVRHTDLR